MLVLNAVQAILGGLGLKIFPGEHPPGPTHTVDTC